MCGVLGRVRWLLLAGAVASGVGGCVVETAGLGSGDAGDGGSAPFPDGCVPATEVCNAADDDCDAATDEGFDVASDVRHCGMCNLACPLGPPNATSRCTAGACRLRCDALFADCDGDASNGCETRLTTDADCGVCGRRCTGAMPLCAGDPPDCMSACGPGETLCGESCVRLSADPASCGACGVACAASEICSDGTCVSSCSSDCTRCGPGGCCTETCTGTCAPSCPGDCPCELDCRELRGDCRASCEGRTTQCAVDCTGADQCHPHCGSGAECEIDCTDARGECRPRCTGSYCLLDCSGAAGECSFAMCTGGSGIEGCGGGIWACNVPCP